MTEIKLEEIKEFLRNKNGYQKEGSKRLRKVLLRKGFIATVATCKEALRQVRNENKLLPVDKDNKSPKILFFDIETSYGIAKVWRPGYKITVRYDDFIKHPGIICVSYKWNNSDEINTLTWDSKQDDKLLVKEFVKVLNQSDVIVAHNGAKFDLPWIRTRALKHGVTMYPKYNMVDTLKIVRYDHNFPSNKLDDLGDYLGLGRKIKTEMKLWDDVIAGNKEALEKMVKYCERDVFLLEDVYDKLSSMTLPALHVGTLNGTTKQTSPYTGNIRIELVKTTTTKAGTIKRLMVDLDTGKYFEMSNTDYKKFLEINK